MKFTAFRKARKFALLVSFILLAGVFCLHIFADGLTPEEIKEQNNALLIQRYDALLELESQNISTADGRKINNYIGVYKNKLNNIDDASLASPGYADIIDLYYKQGEISNRLGWIYYTYIGDFSGEAKMTIDQMHGYFDINTGSITGGLQQEIFGALNEADLSQKAELNYNNQGIYARMYYAIFNEKLKALKETDDSAEVTAILEKAHEEMKNCTVFSSGAQYEAILAETIQKIELQRNKEAAIAELDAVLKILYPKDQTKVDLILTAASRKINAPEITTVTALNEIVTTETEDAFAELTQGKGAYTIALYSELLSTLREKKTEADGADRVISFSPLLAGYPLKKAKAQAKDALVSDLAGRTYGSDAEMLALTEEYNKAGGIFDLCQDINRVSFEQARAALRIELYEAYLKADEQICEYSGAASAPDALVAYETAKTKMMQIDPSAENAEALCQTELSVGKNALQKLVIDAEAKAYESRHNPILSKDPAKITEADKQALIAAVDDLQSLSPGAKAVLEGKNVPDNLGNKYKSLISSIIKNTLGDQTELRTDYLNKLNTEVRGMTADGKANGLPAVLSAADQAVLRAEAIDSVLEVYEEILSDPDYATLSDANKNAVKSIVEDGLKEIYDHKTGDRTELTQKAAQQILKIKRAEACGMIDAHADAKKDLTDPAKEAIEVIRQNAKTKISAMSDLAEIESFADQICFDIQKEQKISDLENETAELIEKIKVLDMLSETEKQNNIKILNNILIEGTLRLRAAEDPNALNSTEQVLFEALKKIEDDAVAQNEKIRQEKKDAVKSKLNEHYEQLIADIDNMTFLDASVRQALKDEAATILQTGLDAVDQAHSASEIEGALGNAEARLTTVKNNGIVQNKATGEGKKAEATIYLNNTANAYKEQINAQEYLSKEEKTKYCELINIELEKFSESLPAMTDGNMLKESAAEINRRIVKIAQNGENKNLGNAKESAVGSLKQSYQTLLDQMNGYWFADSNDLIYEREQADLALENGIAAINACDKPEDVMLLKNSVLGELEQLLQNADLREDTRCVTALTPVVAGLGIACGLELCAFAILLLLNKKKTRLACYFPLSVLSMMAPLMMPVPLAWTLTVLLAIADASLAVFIVLLAVKLVSGQKAGQLETEAVTEFFDEEISQNEECYEATESVVFAELRESEEAEEFAKLAASKELYELTAPDMMEPAAKIEALPEASAPALLHEGQKILELPEKKPTPRLKAVMPPKRLSAPVPKLLIGAGPQIALLSSPDPLAEAEETVATVEPADQICTAAGQEPVAAVKKIYTRKQKAHVNLDVINHSFDINELVSLDSLKEKGLVSRKIGYVKILGRGWLDKPLTVMVQNYSASARNKILLAGGQANLTEDEKL